MKSITIGSNLLLSQMIKSITISKDEPVLYFSISIERPLLQNEERELLFIHEFKITNHNYRSIILSTYPLKSSNTPTFLSNYPFKSSNKYWMRYSLHISMIFSLKLAHILKMKFEFEARW